MMPMRFVCCAALLWVAVPLVSQEAKLPYEWDPKYVAAMTEARKLRKEERWLFAADAFRKAAKLSGGQSRGSLDGLYEVWMKTGRFKEAAGVAEELLELAQGPVQRSLAEGDLGNALYMQAGDKPKPAQLEEAHAALAAAVTDLPKNNRARYTDACVLAKLGRNEEASKEFASCAALLSEKDPMRARTEHFAEDPTLALHRMAPAFQVTAMDGTKFNLDDNAGRVVLIDFWATWCGPCNAELPHMRKIAKEFAEEPLVILSVSWDRDEAKWRDFIAKNDMTWLQYRDEGNRLSNLFSIHNIPHYFTIDSDGVLTAEMVGSGSDVEGKLKKLLKKAKESRPAGAAGLAAHAGTR